MGFLISVLLCAFGAAIQTPPEQTPKISGAFAVSEPVRFDYDRDGTRNRVQFWLEIEGRPAAGKPEEPGYVPEEGRIKYYMLDIDKNAKVFEWNTPLNMGGPPPDKTYPMENIGIEGKTARFEAFNMKWTIVDGGEGIARDTITIDDGFRLRSKKFSSGDVRIGPAKSPRS